MHSIGPVVVLGPDELSLLEPDDSLLLPVVSSVVGSVLVLGLVADIVLDAEVEAVESPVDPSEGGAASSPHPVANMTPATTNNRRIG